MTKTTMHEYKSDPQSGAGNCTCGQAERHRNHFHTFVTAQSWEGLCTCALPESASCHMDMVWASDTHVISKSVSAIMAFQNNSGYYRRKRSSMGKYDILIEVEDVTKGRYIFEDLSRETVNAVMDSMEKDLVFGVWDKDMKLEYFKPSYITKIQINIQ